MKSYRGFKHIEMSVDEIKYKYIEWVNMGVTYANPPDYNSSRDYHHKQYVRVDFKLDEEYFNDTYKPKRK